MNSVKKMAVMAGLFSLAHVVCAAPAEVIDLGTQQSRATVNEGYGSSSATVGSNSAGAGGESGSGSLFLQVQQLRDEVASLRGQMEEQAHTIENLSRQQMEMERRLSGGGANSNTDNSTSSSANNNPSAATSSATNNDGKEEYDAAYNMLKDKEYDKASTAFQAIVDKYPTSNYSGSSLFWLGFVYQTKGDMDGSARAFSSLIEKFPTHSKVDDARYNLGKIYNQQGKTEQARSLLKEVAAGNSKSAPLAKSYLESM